MQNIRQSHKNNHENHIKLEDRVNSMREKNEAEVNLQRRIFHEDPLIP